MRQFIKEHAGNDLNKLLLSASRYPDIDVPFAVGQIACRRQIRDKIPLWYSNELLLYPAGIAVEQCSSEQTALYKQRLTGAGEHVCDLTGGLGVDSFFLSRKAKQVTYIERNAKYCEAARHNFAVLGADNIVVMEGDARSLHGLPLPVDLFYVDPARRSGEGKRIFAVNDCEPDLTLLLPSLLQRAGRVIAKLSPMADLRHTLSILPGVTDIHVLSVRNDCKELLFVIGRDTAGAQPAIHCVHFTAGGREEYFSFTLEEERDFPATWATDGPETFLYEPNPSILKAGAFKSIARKGVSKLHVSSHLYTSCHMVDDFPGRRFKVDDIIPFGSHSCKKLHKTITNANITTRNFPITVKELRRRTGIAEGGHRYLFATTLFDSTKALIVCHKV
ncbi:MAG: SAM-dependent methyltransferase [Tannerellaceae bacterium]|jgi:hypothetical protein|nr:SAM-dependent methyltransferase [Tannerellaceae bacterium]